MSAFAVTITPRTYETDAWGHINNNSICAWFEVARTTYIKDQLAKGEVDAPNSWVLATMTVDFLGETFYGSDVEIRLTEIKVGTKSLSFKCEMYQDGKHTVNGSAVLVYIDKQSKSSQPIPDELRARIEAF